MDQMPGQLGQEFGVERAEQTLDLAPSLRARDGGIDKAEAQAGRDLLEMVAGEIAAVIRIMWPFVLCGLTARWSVISWGRSSVWPHNRLQRLEPLEERRIIAPDGFSTACRSSLCGHVARLERFRLHPQCNFGIAIRRLQADMAQPSTNDIHFHPGFQQMDRRRMAKDMRRNATRHGIRPTLLQMGCVATHEF